MRDRTIKCFKIGIISICAFFILGYSLYEVQKIVSGPKILFTSTMNGATVSESLVTVAGNAKNITNISLNDKKIYVDEKGNFSEQILLSYGYNILSIKAEDRFGKKIDKTLEMIYK
ncbi:MAG: hypothetical protein WCC74_01025 [Minisyncoccia bacterium]